jgi:hypothetical protein
LIPITTPRRAAVISSEMSRLVTGFPAARPMPPSSVAARIQRYDGAAAVSNAPAAASTNSPDRTAREETSESRPASGTATLPTSEKAVKVSPSWERLIPNSSIRCAESTDKAPGR